MKAFRIRYDPKVELESKRKYDWLKGKSDIPAKAKEGISMTQFRSDVYRVGQLVLDKEYQANLRYHDKVVKNGSKD